MEADPRDVRAEITKRLGALTKERAPYIPVWQDLSDYVLGGRGRFLSDNQRMPRSNDNLYNESAKMASNTQAAGMQSGITSPARPWFKLTTPDPDMAEFGPVKEWLGKTEQLLLLIFARSNFYNAMHSMYQEIGTFGQMPVGIYENFDNVIRCVPYTVGSYSIAINGEREVDTLYREYNWTVRQVVTRFGTKNVSQTVKNLWDKGNYDETVELIHACEPNKDHVPDSPIGKKKKYRSVYLEKAGAKDKILLHAGFDEQPFICPRWEVAGEDCYATSYPGINSLGTNKSLQVEEIDKQIAIEKMHNPPLVGDSVLEQSGADLVAGGVSFVPGMAATGKPGLASVYDVNPRIAELTADIREKENRIHRHYYADLFMMITEMDRRQITATEIAERKEEKMLMLGSVLERLNNEALDPIIDRTFAIAVRAGIVPEAPPEIAGAKLRVEYISVLAQAQKAVSTASIEATAAFTMNLAQVFPDAVHKFDAMQAIDEFSKAKGTPPKVIRTDKEAEASMQAQQQAQEQAQQLAMLQQGAETAKTLGDIPSGDDSALAALAAASQ
jgi:hypothetical protein